MGVEIVNLGGVGANEPVTAWDLCPLAAMVE